MSQAPKGQPTLKQEASMPQENEEKVERNEELPADEAQGSADEPTNKPQVHRKVWQGRKVRRGSGSGSKEKPSVGKSSTDHMQPFQHNDCLMPTGQLKVQSKAQLKKYSQPQLNEISRSSKTATIISHKNKVDLLKQLQKIQKSITYRTKFQKNQEQMLNNLSNEINNLKDGNHGPKSQKLITLEEQFNKRKAAKEEYQQEMQRQIKDLLDRRLIINLRIAQSEIVLKNPHIRLKISISLQEQLKQVIQFKKKLLQQLEKDQEKDKKSQEEWTRNNQNRLQNQYAQQKEAENKILQNFNSYQKKQTKQIEMKKLDIKKLRNQLKQQKNRLQNEKKNLLSELQLQNNESKKKIDHDYQERINELRKLQQEQLNDLLKQFNQKKFTIETQNYQNILELEEKCNIRIDALKEEIKRKQSHLQDQKKSFRLRNAMIKSSSQEYKDRLQEGQQSLEKKIERNKEDYKKFKAATKDEIKLFQQQLERISSSIMP